MQADFPSLHAHVLATIPRHERDRDSYKWSDWGCPSPLPNLSAVLVRLPWVVPLREDLARKIIAHLSEVRTSSW